MPIKPPENLCFHDNKLAWTPNPLADGYNVHFGNATDGQPPEYIASVLAEDGACFDMLSANDSRIITQPELLRVDAWVNGIEKTAFSHKSDFASEIRTAKSGEILFRDDFTSLDTDYWLPRFPYWTDPINNEAQTYVPGQLSIQDDGLHIDARRVDETNIVSGMISGDVNRSYLYGLFKAEITLPEDQVGLWPAFWLLNEKYVGKRPEIDIMEAVGGKIYQTYHWWNPSQNRIDQPVPQILEAGYYEFALLWEPGALTWYVDSVPVQSLRGPFVSDQRMYPLFNLAVGGNWPGAPLPSFESAKMIVHSFEVSKI